MSKGNLEFGGMDTLVWGSVDEDFHLELLRSCYTRGKILSAVICENVSLKNSFTFMLR